MKILLYVETLIVMQYLIPNIKLMMKLLLQYSFISPPLSVSAEPIVIMPNAITINSVPTSTEFAMLAILASDKLFSLSDFYAILKTCNALKWFIHIILSPLSNNIHLLLLSNPHLPILCMLERCLPQASSPLVQHRPSSLFL